MSYQPPSFEYTQSEDHDNINVRDCNKPLSPVNRINRRSSSSNGGGISALKPNGRDTPNRKSRGGSNGFRSPRTPGGSKTKNASKTSSSSPLNDDTSESTLLNSGLSATEMLQRLRKEKEVLVQKHREVSHDIISTGTAAAP
eukprot:scaffold70091_cov66-Cyclotella_meneghiniana.AAC.1